MVKIADRDRAEILFAPGNPCLNRANKIQKIWKIWQKLGSGSLNTLKNDSRFVGVVDEQRSFGYFQKMGFPMKLVTWNCAMAFHKKSSLLFSLGANVMVIQECSQKSIEQIASVEGFTAAWFGSNPNKGIARWGRNQGTYRKPIFRQIIPN